MTYGREGNRGSGAMRHVVYHALLATAASRFGQVQRVGRLADGRRRRRRSVRGVGPRLYWDNGFVDARRGRLERGHAGSG